MANVIYFSIIELLCGFAPNYTVFLILRALFGIGMGGEWGVGASLAMEAAPTRWRGILSGILQSGYSIGYLLAAVATRFVLPAWGWRPMFWLGALPATAGSLHSHQGAGVGGVAASSRRQHGRSAARGGVELQTVFVPCGADGVHDVSFARHAGFVSGLFEGDSQGGAVPCGEYSDDLQRRSGDRGGDIWIVVAIAWKAQGDDGSAGLCLLVMPFWAFGWSVPVLNRGDRVHADGRAGSVGRDSGAPE